MPIYVGNSGSTKVLGMTKTSQDQQNIKTDTIFHSSLPYVRVIEHELTSYSFTNQKMWVQQYGTPYWNQVQGDGVSTVWWCGQLFPLTQQLQNMLQNTNRGFMVFIQWNDGYWEPLTQLSFENEPLYTWDNANNFTLQQNISVCNYYRNTYGLSEYATQLFIPRRKVNGQDMVDSNAYVTKVRILELVGLDVQSDGTITVQAQNPAQNQQIKIDNQNFVIGSVNIMQERYLQLLTNVTTATTTTKTHNVQQDMVYPSSISYTMSTMDLVSKNRTNGLQGRTPRNAPPINYSANSQSVSYNVMTPAVGTLTVLSLTNSWTRMQPQAQTWCGGVMIPRLGTPDNQTTYISQTQGLRRDDFVNRAIGSEQASGSQVMQVAVLAGDKFGAGVYMDSRRPQIGRGGRELFSPDTQGVARVGPTRIFTTPREQLIGTYAKDAQNVIYQFHNKQVLSTITLSAQEQNQNTFILSTQSSYNPTGAQTTNVNCQITTGPQDSSGATFRKTKRSNQDSQVGYTIQGCTVSDANNQSWVLDITTYSGAFRATDQTRQVHQIYLQAGSKFIVSESEASIISGLTGALRQTLGIIHYIERVGNTLNLVSETYISNNFNDDDTGFTGLGNGIFCGGYKIGLAQVL